MTMYRRMLGGLLAAAVSTVPVRLIAQSIGAQLIEAKTPRVITTPGPVATNLGSTIFINQGLVGVGRISASQIDSFGESFGSVSGLQITDWMKHWDGSYTGTFNILPDRGYNSGAFYSDYAARINEVTFRFTPHDDAAPIGGTTDLEKLLAQNQITFTSQVFGTRFTYKDPHRPGLSPTTGLDPGTSFATLFGKIVPYVTSFTGPQSPSAAASNTYDNINKLALDAEALVLKHNGSGYIGDEYGANIYYFNPNKQIVGVIVPPAAFQPHLPAGTPFFSSAGANPVDGRRFNQGLEGVALSPDGTRLFALLQSATMQDSDASAQNRRQTRLLIYDVSVNPVPLNPVASYALTLPTYRTTGNGAAVNATAAQSEIVALDRHRFLVLSRDGNGLGNANPNPSVIKSVLLVDTRIGNPTNIVSDAATTTEAGKITSVPGELLPSITPLAWTEAINLLNSTQLSKFNIALDTGAGQVSKFTLGEKWEGLSLVPAYDRRRPNDYFLFVGNDNDFVTSAGRIKGPDGTIVSYNAFNGYPASRVPAPLDSANNENDTLLLAYRVTIISGATLPDATAPVVVPHVHGNLGRNGVYTSAVSVSWDVDDDESGIVSRVGCGTRLLIAETDGTTLTCTATNGAGLTTTVPVTIKIDRKDHRHSW